ncbi:hypothetical protein DSLASN_41610 [Desulfoluna limicola]|uniref:Uncharacterized protein n=1 Tax=Desulfoluna limicola TaxID=2810562 RepID=A0ABN6FC71_9BACT|nr:hypothetical protein [Desulfoluna limicola]BCS98529.1 hypothetical protein DSLASN_41610 [Desulfoluna limicola]
MAPTNGDMNSRQGGWMGMTVIVISGGERTQAQALVRALETSSGSTAMDDEALISMAAEGWGGGSLLFSWALWGAHPLADRVGMQRTCAKAKACRAMLTALGQGVRIFHGDLGHLLYRFPVPVYRVLLSGKGEGSGQVGARRRRRLFGESFLSHAFYDMHLPCGSDSVGEEAGAILERTALALGDPGCPLSTECLRLAIDMADAELDLVHRGVDVEFWGHDGRLTVWNRSPLGNHDLEERVHRLYALGTATCRRGIPPLIFDERLPYTLSTRVEGARSLDEAVADVRERNGARPASAKAEVVLHGGIGWGERILVDFPEALSDPEEVVWRLVALYPGRRFILPAPRYAWVVSRMGLDAGNHGVPMGEGR